MIIQNPKTVELTSIIALDLETTGVKPWQDKIDLIAIRTEANLYVLEADKYSLEFLIDLFKEIESRCLVVGHNIKFDMGFILYHYGVLLTKLHCTQVTAQIIENGYQRQRDFDLASVLERYLHVYHKDSEKVVVGKKRDGTPKYTTRKALFQKSFIDPELGPIYRTTPKIREKQIAYAVEDVEHLHGLYYEQLERIQAKNLDQVYRLEHTVMPVICKMEIGGCYIDKKPWEELIHSVWIPEQKQLKNQLDNEVDRLLEGRDFKYRTHGKILETTQFDLFGASAVSTKQEVDSLNYDSQEQILELIEFLGQPLPLNEEGEPSTEEGVLNVYLTENSSTTLSHFIDTLLKYRQISKLISTYGIEMLAKLDRNGYIHTLYTQTQTNTGRASSKSPNLQNIPRPPKNDPTKDIRRFFIASPGNVLITCDMDAAEVRIAADYSNEPLLVDSLLKGVDMHSELASVSYSILFDRPVVISKSTEPLIIDAKSYIPSELRDVHKSVTFAKFYKGGAKRVYGVLSEYINAHQPADKRGAISKKISDAFDEKVPVLSKYLSDKITEAQEKGTLIGSKLGRIRYFKRDVYGQAANYPIQNCIHPDTYIITKTGLKRIKNCDLGVNSVWNGEEFAKCTIKSTGEKELYEIYLKGGLVLKCSPNHKLLVADHGRTPRWVSAKNLKENSQSRVLLNTSTAEWHNDVNIVLSGTETSNAFRKQEPTKIINIKNKDKDLFGFWIGRLASDGSIGKNGVISQIVSDKEKDIIKTINNGFSLFGDYPVKYKISAKSGYMKLHNISVNSVNLLRVFEEMGVKNKIPDLLLSDSTVLKGYLRGMFDGDGCIQNAGTARQSISLKFGTGHKHLEWANQIQQALLSFGILSSVTLNKESIQVSIWSKSLIKFAELIGFECAHKKNELVKLRASTFGLFTTRLGKFLALRVKKVIKTGGFVDMLDVCDIKNNKFTANGIITHNTNGEALKIALINIDRYFEKTGYGRLVLQVHDEVVCEVREEYANLAKTEIEKIMAQSLEWFLEKIPGKATAHIDKSWHK